MSIIFNRVKYEIYPYKNEKEMEKFVVENAQSIFGENAFYFSVKKRIESRKRIGTIPDGYLLNLDSDRFYLLEIELKEHDVLKHISGQLVGFDLAFKNDNSKKEIIKILLDEIDKDPIKMKKINKKTSEMTKYIFSTVFFQYGIVIIINEKNPEELYEVVEHIENAFKIDTLIVPFETFVNERGEFIHIFVSPLEKRVIKEPGKWRWTTVSMTKHLSRIGENLIPVYEKLREKILGLGENAKEVSRKGWVTYQIAPLKNFCAVKFKKGYLEVHLKTDEDFFDGRRIARDIKRTQAWSFDKVFQINTTEEVDYAFSLIKQAYNCICKNG